LLSRRLVSQVLSASVGGTELDLILANTNLNRVEISSTGIMPPKEQLMERIRRVGSFLTKGTKFGTLLPLLLALLLLLDSLPLFLMDLLLLLKVR
jgi:hypothetical protein